MFGPVLRTQPVFAADAPVITPVRLDFDANHAPKNCNNDAKFRELLVNWVLPMVLIADADRRLVVRIRRSSTGGKLAEVTLMDGAGATLKEHQERYGAKTECHLVLYDTAYAAAKLLGAFEKPPLPTPVVCPPVPTLPIPAPCPTCPTCPASALPASRMTLFTPPARRAFIGAGVFLGMTSNSEAFAGPSMSLGFIPLSHRPGFQVEFDGAWISLNTPLGLRTKTIPLFVSLCHLHHGLRLCGGLATTFFFNESTTANTSNDELRATLAATLRLGTELKIKGPFSIRVDAFALVPLTQRIAFDAPKPLTAGTTAMAIWSFH